MNKVDLEKLRKDMIEYRAKNNLTLEKLAAMCKLSYQTIQSIEKGYQTPSRLTVYKIENVIKNGKE